MLEVWETVYVFSVRTGATALASTLASSTYPDAAQAWPTTYIQSMGQSLAVHEQTLTPTTGSSTTGRFFDFALPIAMRAVITIEVHGGAQLPLSSAVNVVNEAVQRFKASCQESA